MEQYRTSKIYSILEFLEETDSRLDKELILEANKDNEIWKKFLYYTYTPEYKYGVINLPDDILETEYIGLKCPEDVSVSDYLHAEFFGLLDMLRKRELTGNAALEAIRKLFEQMDEENRYLFQCVLDRDVNAGISTKTINKVYKGHIPIFECQLATTGEPVFPAIAEIKQDGVRVLAIVKDGDITFTTRNGIQFYLPNIADDIHFMVGDKDIVLDGEITGVNRKKVSGQVNKYLKGTAPEGLDRDFLFTIFDILPYNEFVTQTCSQPQKERTREILKLFKGVKTEQLRPTTARIVKTQDEIDAMLSKAFQEGEEGLIIKDMTRMYEYKRSDAWLKLKAELEKEMIITGMQEGTGKYRGLLGALSCKSSDGVIKVNVGSGLSDADRKELWFNKEHYIGKIVKVRYNERIDNSLFLPRYVEIREDKNCADHSKDF